MKRKKWTKFGRKMKDSDSLFFQKSSGKSERHFRNSFHKSKKYKNKYKDKDYESE